MKKLLIVLGTVMTVALVAAITLPTVGARPVTANTAVQADGQKMFLDQKCNMCHDVSSAGITATTKSEKMKGPNLSGLGKDADWVLKYLKKEVDIDGKKHTKAVKGTDEEVKALADWIAAQ